MVTYAKRPLTEAAPVIVLLVLAAPAASETPRTPWGVPDLNGTWKFSVSTPLERDDAMGDKKHYTHDEAAAYLADGQARVEGLAAAFDGGEDRYVGLELWVPTDTPMTRDLRTSLIYDPDIGKIPFTPAGLERFANSGHFEPPDGPEDRAPYERCIIGFNMGPPLDPTFEYNDMLQIFQARETVVIMTEMVNDARIVPLDGRAPLPDDVRQWRGDSRGYWDGDTLVVETRNFREETAYMGSGTDMRLTERFTRVSEDMIEYDFRVEDPVHFETSWAARTELRRSGDPLFEYACHEHNYSMEYMLSGARAQEAEQNDAGH